MKLGDWLKRNQVTRADFARRIGVSPGAVTLICREHRSWLSRETAERIVAETLGAVTPNDFLDPAPTTPIGLDMHHPATAAIEAFARGEIVAVTDDDDRENEGDLIVAASLCTTEKMAFIIRHCCGIVCAPLTSDDARRLNLSPMVATNEAPLGTAFTVSVDVRHGLTTGISAEQRTNTVRALANRNMGASDFVRPGHVFPLVAKDGGVLMRSGHTEAAVDLCKLAGLAPVAVICELANDDGTVMVGPQVEAFAEKHRITRISVADLIAYRQAREKLVERVACFPIQTPIGELQGYAYRTPFDPVLHFAFVHGEHRRRARRAGASASGRYLERHFRRRPIPKVLSRFKAEGRGALVYLRDGAAGVPANLSGAHQTGSDDARETQWREIGLGAQILRDLGVTSIRLRTDNPRTYVGLSGFGIEIAAVEPIDG